MALDLAALGESLPLSSRSSLSSRGECLPEKLRHRVALDRGQPADTAMGPQRSLSLTGDAMSLLGAATCSAREKISRRARSAHDDGPLRRLFAIRLFYLFFVRRLEPSQLEQALFRTVGFDGKK